MARLHQYDYLLAIGTIFAFLDAWNIGANDVANSWATSVGSRSVTYLQAMGLASVMEFSGSIGVGARVADTIRTKVVKTELFRETPALLMLGMVCAVTASSLYLTFATRIGLPVSTTHSIMGGVIGMGIAAVGSSGIQWVGSGSGTERINGGVVSVFLAWVIAPGISACFGAIIFLITKFGILLRKNPAHRALMTVPIYFAVTGCLLTMLLLWKGGSYTIDLTDAEIAGTIVGAGAAFGILIGIFLCPFLYRKVIKNDWQLRFWHVFLGPLLLRRPEPPEMPEDYHGGIRNFYEGHLTKEELEARRARQGGVRAASDEEAGKEKRANTEEANSEEGDPDDHLPERKQIVGPKPEGKWYTSAVLFWYVKWLVFRGVDQDVVNMQKKRSILSGDVEELHARAAHYDNTTEYMFTFLQVLTASTASFTHGANDVSNAIGPYATVFQIWDSGALPEKDKAHVPIWILAFGGAAIALGIWTYGYNIMKNLGNRITLHSPSRGFSMELGSAVTIILATRLKLPVSTTQCITGATVGVGLCSGDWRTINWRMVAWIYGGWVITLPTAGIMSGCLMGIIINAPRWGWQG
ncbi:Phosphate transporter [Pleurostoma richardsiae]|uniref:Phosphate transporter n=1 Tax=Pleurostoma richardsiae TaxID=41990 RepID=A0AA38VKA8_9PEZI|nr:Phosphate transporter [Pleurostoma richardsiae]